MLFNDTASDADLSQCQMKYTECYAQWNRKWGEVVMPYLKLLHPGICLAELRETRRILSMERQCPGHNVNTATFETQVKCVSPE